jgi:hypothetical protein
VPLPRWKQAGVGIGLLASALLVGFHGLLLWERILDLSIFEPLVALEWTAGILLLVVLRRLRQRDIPLFHGRKAVAFWLLVLLLHFIAAPPGASWIAEPGGLLLALPATWILLGWLATLVALWLTGLMDRQLSATAPRHRRGSPPDRTRTSPGYRRQLLARPPPLASSI